MLFIIIIPCFITSTFKFIWSVCKIQISGVALLEVWRIEDSWLFVISRIYSRALNKKYVLKYIVLYNCQVLKHKYFSWSNVLFTWKKHNVFCSHSFWLHLQSHFDFASYKLPQSNLGVKDIEKRSFNGLCSVRKRQLFCRNHWWTIVIIFRM